MGSGGGGGAWSSTGIISYISSGGSSSGTLVSTAYTSSSGSQAASSDYYLGKQERRICRDDLLLEQEWWEWELEWEIMVPLAQRRKKYAHIRGLVEEYFSDDGAPSGTGDDVRVLERWFTELDVGWVLKLAIGKDDDDGASSAQLLALYDFAPMWIRALYQIMDSINRTYLYFSSNNGSSGGLLFSVAEEEAASEESLLLDHVQLARGLFLFEMQLARFAEAAVLKMLQYVDAIAAPTISLVANSSSSSSAEAFLSNNNHQKEQRRQALLYLHATLSNASRRTQLSWLKSDEVLSRLSKRQGTLITVYGIRTVIMALLNDDQAWWATPQGRSPGIHRFTRSVISFISLLPTDCFDQELDVQTTTLLGTAAADLHSFTPSVCRLEEKLAEKSLSFPDHSLGLLFLINNLHFLHQKLTPTTYTEFHMLPSKIEDCMQRYLQVSWAPVLSCLQSSTPHCLGRYSPLLPKFEYEFEKTYSTQKLWKVPDPALRGRLRKAIIDKVTLGFKEFLQDNSITTTQGITYTPRELEERLQELFEG